MQVFGKGYAIWRSDEEFSHDSPSCQHGRFHRHDDDCNYALVQWNESHPRCGLCIARNEIQQDFRFAQLKGIPDLRFQRLNPFETCLTKTQAANVEAVSE